MTGQTHALRSAVDAAASDGSAAVLVGTAAPDSHSLLGDRAPPQSPESSYSTAGSPATAQPSMPPYHRVPGPGAEPVAGPQDDRGKGGCGLVHAFVLTQPSLMSLAHSGTLCSTCPVLNLDQILTFGLAAAILIAIPGPSVVFVVGRAQAPRLHGARSGSRRGCEEARETQGVQPRRGRRPSAGHP